MKKKSIISLVVCICMIFITSFSSVAAVTKESDPLQPGWIQINENRFENPSTGEYFQINQINQINQNKRPAPSTSVSFSFKIKYTFRCPTKFKATSTTAKVNADAHMEAPNGEYLGEFAGHAYAIDVGSKTAKFKIGSRHDVTIGKLRNKSTYTVTARNVDDSGVNYVVGDATVE